MKNTPVDYQTARKIIDGYGLPDFGKATIREVVAISTQLEQETKTEFIHMEMGVPGLKAAQVGVDAEIKALQDGVASIYPNINGTSDVKRKHRFIKAFIDIDIAPEGCVPVTGSMQGTYASFLVCGQCTPGKDTILFIVRGSLSRSSRSQSWAIDTNRLTCTNTGAKNSGTYWNNISPKATSQP